MPGDRPGGDAGAPTRIVRVVPDVAALDRRFDYSVPERWRDQVAPGARVRVPLHGRRVAAWVVDPDVRAPPPGVALRDLSGVSGIGPPPAVLALAEWAAWRWAGPLATTLRAASPAHNVWSLPPVPALEGDAVEALSAAAGATAGLEEALAGAWAPGPASVLRVPPAADLLPVVAAALGAAGTGAGSVVVLVPGTGWAERLAARLRRRGVPVASGWADARAGWPVVVGTRSAAWAPVPRLAAAVVLDAHDESYASGWPPFDAPEVLAERARREGAPCLLVSPCPTAEQSAGRTVRGPRPPAEHGGWPAVSVIDRRGDDPRTGLYAEETVRAVRRALEGAGDGAARPPVACVLHRTGRERLLACAACGELARCERCGRATERADDALSCRGCGQRRPVVCAACGATGFKALRIGVQRAREELAALLGVTVGEVWGPPPRPGPPAPGGAGDRPGVPEVPPDPVLVGTEAVLHRLRRAALVVFLDFDQHLLAPRFTAAEHALGLVARAGRLVGGRDRAGGTGAVPGTVLVQTRLPGHPVLEAAVRGRPELLAAHERALRAELSLPPFSALAVVAGPGARAALAPLVPDTAGAPGGPGLEASELAEERWLVRAPDHRALCDALSGIDRSEGAVRVVVDPRDV